jgi:titin
VTGSQQISYQKSSYTNGSSTNGHTTSTVSIQEEFKVDTFEYRLLREKEFRQSITRREAGEADAEIPAQPTSGPITPPQISQKARNSKLLEGSDATFTAKISANPAPRVSFFFHHLKY